MKLPSTTGLPYLVAWTLASFALFLYPPARGAFPALWVDAAVLFACARFLPGYFYRRVNEVGREMASMVRDGEQRREHLGDLSHFTRKAFQERGPFEFVLAVAGIVLTLVVFASPLVLSFQPDFSTLGQPLAGVELSPGNLLRLYWALYCTWALLTAALVPNLVRTFKVLFGVVSNLHHFTHWDLEGGGGRRADELAGGLVIEATSLCTALVFLLFSSVCGFIACWMAFFFSSVDPCRRYWTALDRRRAAFLGAGVAGAAFGLVEFSRWVSPRLPDLYFRAVLVANFALSAFYLAFWLLFLAGAWGRRFFAAWEADGGGRFPSDAGSGRSSARAAVATPAAPAAAPEPPSAAVRGATPAGEGSSSRRAAAAAAVMADAEAWGWMAERLRELVRPSRLSLLLFACSLAWPAYLVAAGPGPWTALPLGTWVLAAVVPPAYVFNLVLFRGVEGAAADYTAEIFHRIVPHKRRETRFHFYEAFGSPQVVMFSLTSGALFGLVGEYPWRTAAAAAASAGTPLSKFSFAFAFASTATYGFSMSLVLWTVYHALHYYWHAIVLTGGTVEEAEEACDVYRTHLTRLRAILTWGVAASAAVFTAAFLAASNAVEFVPVVVSFEVFAGLGLRVACSKVASIGCSMRLSGQSRPELLRGSRVEKLLGAR
ncbi:MAG: hypothetical protein Kow0069_36930 [Promethearchaeota archaeon]